MKAAIFKSNWHWHSWCPCGETWHAPANRLGWDFVRVALDRHVRTHSDTLKGLPWNTPTRPSLNKESISGYGHTMCDISETLFDAHDKGSRPGECFKCQCDTCYNEGLL